MSTLMKKDSFVMGLLLGLAVPVVVYGLLRLLYALMDSLGVFSDVGFAEDFRTRTLMLFAICANIIASRFFLKSQYHSETIRGMLFASMLLVLVWFVKFGVKMLSF
jgi:hypothetical protein